MVYSILHHFKLILRNQILNVKYTTDLYNFWIMKHTQITDVLLYSMVNTNISQRTQNNHKNKVRYIIILVISKKYYNVTQKRAYC